jgi:glycosyltransferase involved in cell wall biosynthesis
VTKLRLMHITRTLGMGGMEHVISTLCRTLDPGEFECSVLCLKGAGPVAEELDAAGVQVHQIESQEDVPDYLASLKVRSLLRRHRVDVVHTHNTTALLFGASGARMAGVRTIVHTDHARSYPERRRITIAENLVARLVYRVVAVSEETRTDLWRRIGIPERKLAIIPNGVAPGAEVEPSEVASIRQALGVGPDDVLVGLGARLVEQKGLAYLVEAMDEVQQRNPKVRLVIAGDGDLRESLEQDVAQRGLAGTVQFLGMRRDLSRLLRAFDLYALPSIWEGLPLVVLEAMAAGLPLVASDVGGVATAVTHQANGLLVPPKDVGALSASILTLAADPELRGRMGRKGREVFDRQFSAEAMARQYSALYRRQVS